MQRRRKATTLAAVVFAATTLLSSCGLYDDAGSDTSSGETSPTDKKLSKQDIEVGATATGGKAGVRATGVPVKIGFITDNGIQGLEGEPFLNSMKAAVAFINNDLGGVDGHPLEVVTCEITQTEDEGTVCAQKMVNDPSIVAVVAGAISLGDAQILNTLKGSKPMFAAIPSGPADATAPNVYGFNGGIMAAGSMLTYVAKNLDAKSVSIIGVQSPVISQIIGMWTDALKRLGVSKVTTSMFPLGSTDLTSTIVASGAAKADVILLSAPNTAPCISIAKGLEQMAISKPTVSLGNCADPAVKEAVGDLPEWTYYSPYRNTQAEDSSGESAAYTAAVNKYADGSLSTTNFAPAVFATVMSMTKVLNNAVANTSGKLPTVESISAAAKAYTGPVFLGPETIAFGKPPFPSLGSVSGLFYEYKGDGKWALGADGEWVSPPLGP